MAASDRGVSKIYFIAPPDFRRAFEERLSKSGLRTELTVTSSGSEFVEILAGGVNKRSALRAMLAVLGIPREDTVASGDEENDIPALKQAGLGIAMGNGAEPVKRAAAIVTKPNTSDGWADAIERYILMG